MNNFNGILNQTIIETDLDGNFLNNVETPFWLSDIMEQALAASGIGGRRNVASKDAIASLEAVDATDITEDSCPICYEPYQADQNKKLKVDETLRDNTPISVLNRQLEQLDDYGVDLAPPSLAIQFRDPSLFMPVDAIGQAPVRFPQANLYTGEEVTEAQMFPTITKKLPAPDSNCAHTPVRMPHCNHIFGKPCIIEWLHGHVSCPLCRKEVESVKNRDPKQAKADRIRDNCNFRFSTSTEDSVAHLVERLTDVFNPYRRPFHPSVTPLTDSPVAQVLATPCYPDYLSPTPAETPDPSLTMARNFPLSHLGQQAAPRRNRPFGNGIFEFLSPRDAGSDTNVPSL